MCRSFIYEFILLKIKGETLGYDMKEHEKGVVTATVGEANGALVSLPRSLSGCL